MTDDSSDKETTQEVEKIEQLESMENEYGEKELASDLAERMKNLPPKTAPLGSLLEGYDPGGHKAKMDSLPFETQKEVVDLYLGTGGRKKSSAQTIASHLKKQGINIHHSNLAKWLQKRSAGLYRDMISEKNEEIISTSYADMLGNFAEANRIMFQELLNLSHCATLRKGKVQDMKYCFDSLQSGLTELRSHMENSKTSDYRSAQKIIDEITEEAGACGITDLAPTPKVADINKP
jgi:hypothetical protein